MNEVLEGDKEFKIVLSCELWWTSTGDLGRFMPKLSKNRTKTLRLRRHMGSGWTRLAILGQSGADKGQVSERPNTTDNSMHVSTNQAMTTKLVVK